MTKNQWQINNYNNYKEAGIIVFEFNVNNKFAAEHYMPESLYNQIILNAQKELIKEIEKRYCLSSMDLETGISTIDWDEWEEFKKKKGV